MRPDTTGDRCASMHRRPLLYKCACCCESRVHERDEAAAAHEWGLRCRIQHVKLADADRNLLAEGLREDDRCSALVAAKSRKSERRVDRKERAVALVISVFPVKPFLVHGDVQALPQSQLAAIERGDEIALAAVLPAPVALTSDDALIKLREPHIDDDATLT